VAAPGEPEEVVTTAKKNHIRNAFAANWREGRTAMVSTYVFMSEKRRLGEQSEKRGLGDCY
jgi:hypothetical protein